MRNSTSKIVVQSSFTTLVVDSDIVGRARSLQALSFYEPVRYPIGSMDSLYSHVDSLLVSIED